MSLIPEMHRKIIGGNMIYGQQFSHTVRAEKCKKQSLVHVKALKTPVLKYRLKGKVLSFPGCTIYFKV